MMQRALQIRTATISPGDLFPILEIRIMHFYGWINLTFERRDEDAARHV